MAKKPSPAKPSVADDEAALVGAWIREDEYALLKIRRTHGLRAYVLHEKGISLSFGLEDRDGGRVLVEKDYDTDGEHQNPLYEYHLRGDRLELKLLPGAAAKFDVDENLKILDDLGGTWYRVRINRDAGPGAAADRRGA